MLNHISTLIIIQLPHRHQNLKILIMKFNKVRNTHYKKLKKKSHSISCSYVPFFFLNLISNINLSYKKKIITNIYYVSLDQQPILINIVQIHPDINYS